MERREFLKTTFAVGFGLSTGVLSLSAKNIVQKQKPSKILNKRTLGKTGEKLSIVGLGGVVMDKMDSALARELTAEVMDLGLNYFDVAPSYGNAEVVMGEAIKGRRDRIFLACKTLERDKEGALKELHRSLERLHTDRFDLYQFHALSSMEDVEKIFGPNGAVETFVKAREEGKVRYIGFSAHSVKAALAAMDRFDFDTVLFPINFVLFFEENFGPQVIAKAKEKGMSILALKALALSLIPEGQKRPFEKCWYVPVSEREKADKALRFTLSQPITAAVPPGDPELFRMAVDLALHFRPITEEQKKELQEYAKGKDPIFKLDL
jgi:aryl-alcohol dehydrogenase-like predicted oxidoreductase